jgi:hypothetical protein
MNPFAPHFGAILQPALEGDGAEMAASANINQPVEPPKEDVPANTRLTFLREAGRDAKRNVLVVCRCSCGKELTVRRSSVLRGATKSCGCLWREAIASGRLDYHKRTGHKPTPDGKNIQNTNSVPANTIDNGSKPLTIPTYLLHQGRDPLPVTCPSRRRRAGRRAPMPQPPPKKCSRFVTQ